MQILLLQVPMEPSDMQGSLSGIGVGGVEEDRGRTGVLSVQVQLPATAEPARKMVVRMKNFIVLAWRWSGSRR